MHLFCLFPENGLLLFYLSGDSSVCDLDIDKLRQSDLYELAVENKGRYVYSYVPKWQTFPYLRNTSDKLVTSRELKNGTGFICQQERSCHNVS